MTPGQRAEIAAEALELLDQAAELVRSLNDPRLRAYVQAELEGNKGPAGYMGMFARDYLDEYRADQENALIEDPEGA